MAINKVTKAWWGFEVCLDEQHTQQLIASLSDEATVATNVGNIVSAISEDFKPVGQLVAACLTIGAALLKAVDHFGGGKGVCIQKTWAPTPQRRGPPWVPLGFGQWVMPQK